jgi:hemerythrin superfamily protein
MADLPVPSRSAPSQTVAIQYQHVEISNHCSLVTPRRTPTTVGAVAPWVQPGTQHEKEHNMDVTELLQQDHRTVEGLFSQYRATQDDATVEQICQELERHTTVEEEIVYPRLAEIDPELEQHAEEEHATAKELIAQVRSRPDDVARLVEQLQQSVQDHVEEEESKAFPALRQRLGDELDDLGKAVEQRKQELM